MNEQKLISELPQDEHERTIYQLMNLIYFTTNFPSGWVEKCFPGNQHIQEKFYATIQTGMETNGFVHPGDIIRFLQRLDGTNIRIALNYIMDKYTFSEDTRKKLFKS